MIYGQEKAKKEIESIAKDISNGINHNVVICGKSGYGKSTLAIYLCKLSKKNYKIILGNQPIQEYDIIVIDEAHLMKNAETLFDIMDKHTSSVIILTTELGELIEPLVNRCILIQLEEYSRKDLLDMAKYYGKGLSIYTINEIVSRCRGVPRNIYLLIERAMISKRNQENVNLNNFGFYPEGFTDMDYSYLNALKFLGFASLNTISKYTGIPIKTIEKYIEPFLLRKNLIKITSKGRSLNGN